MNLPLASKEHMRPMDGLCKLSTNSEFAFGSDLKAHRWYLVVTQSHVSVTSGRTLKGEFSSCVLLAPMAIKAHAGPTMPV